MPLLPLPPGSREGVTAPQSSAQATRSPGVSVPLRAIAVASPTMTLVGLMAVTAVGLVACGLQQTQLRSSLQLTGAAPVGIWLNHRYPLLRCHQQPSGRSGSV